MGLGGAPFFVPCRKSTLAARPLCGSVAPIPFCFFFNYGVRSVVRLPPYPLCDGRRTLVPQPSHSSYGARRTIGRSRYETKKPFPIARVIGNGFRKNGTFSARAGSVRAWRSGLKLELITQGKLEDAVARVETFQGMGYAPVVAGIENNVVILV